MENSSDRKMVKHAATVQESYVVGMWRMKVVVTLC